MLRIRGEFHCDPHFQTRHVMSSGFTFLRIDAYYQKIAKGLLIVGAVVANQAGTFGQRKWGWV